MHIHLIQVGKTKAPFDKIEAEFQKRLSSFAKLKTTTLSVSSKEKESQEIAQNIEKGSFLIILDERGKQITSQEFAEVIEKQRDHGSGKITFVIGGPEGVTPELRDAKQNKPAKNQTPNTRPPELLLSLSKMTLAHQFARALFWEQLYRASTIISGHPYHK